MVFRDLSINRKLTLIMMVTSSVALLVACAGFMAYDLMTARQAMVDDLTGHAHLFGANSTAALTFADSDAAAEMLSSLRAQPHITDAILYDIDGKLCARYSRDKDRNNGPLQAPKAGHEFGSGCLHLVSLIELNGKKIGTIYLRSDLRQLYVRIQRYLVITAVVLFCASSVAYLLLVWLKRIISGPITQLAQTARAVSTSRDYSIRAVRESNDELGVMIDCFNEMLTQVQQRAEEVRQHREHLEDQVRSRTNELQQTNIQLSAAKDRAEAASRAKSTFLANMSHEIRTPMTAIIGYSDMMVEGDQTASDRLNALQIIRRNARHLTDLINDILDISKIEAGKMTVERITCSLPQLAVDVASLMRLRAREKGLTFQLLFEGAIPAAIQTDPLRLRQILVNLIGNALKFTSQGGITLRVCCEGGEERGVIRFVVADTGIGIDADKIQALFQPFTQADDSTTRRFGGTGLGLAISQSLAALLGGDIHVQSQPGEGSQFTVRIDVGTLRGVQMLHDLNENTLELAPAQGPVKYETLCGRILLAEDGPDNQLLISTYLRKAGAEVVIAADGKIAVEQALGQRFDVILMDMQMPVMDGYTAAGVLREKKLSMPIIALTAHATSGDREKCLAAGCTDYLTKPVDRKRLLSTVAGYLRQRQAAA